MQAMQPQPPRAALPLRRACRARRGARRRMARMRPVLILVAAACAWGQAVHAVEVFRCVAADGSTMYQDRPCASGQAQQSLQLPDDPPLPPAVAPEPAPEPAPVEPAAVAGPPPAPAGPEFLLCTRYDGSRYISEDGSIGGTSVPYAMVAGSGRSLADTYGGRNGAGVSAPGLREVPRIPAREAPLAGAYVWVADECHHAGPDEACAWLRSELDDVTRKLDRAFSDTTPALKQQQSALRERMSGC